MTENSEWDIREDCKDLKGFAITRNGEDFMGWYRTRDDAIRGIRLVLEGASLPDLLGSITRSNRPVVALHPGYSIGGQPDRTVLPVGDADADVARLDWLQNRGRVKARKYGDMKDNFTWDCTSAKSLREAIDLRMKTESGDDAPDARNPLEYCRQCGGSHTRHLKGCTALPKPSDGSW